jgi:pimeloyl-ACP methyl ester carboxylesterase
LDYPDRVRHLVLVDPWGFGVAPSPEELQEIHRIPNWVKAMSGLITRYSPLAGMRAAGPWGPTLVRRLRRDLGVRYPHNDSSAIYEYIYQCNAQNPTGEYAFHSMSKFFGYAKRPMLDRFLLMDQNVPSTILRGDRSWIKAEPFEQIRKERKNAYVDFKIVHHAGHHIYADNPKEFEKIMRSVSQMVEDRKDLQ